MSEAYRPLLSEEGFGLIITPHSVRKWYKHEKFTWAADNGCFVHPEKFDAVRYTDWLASQDLGNCLFATAPDVVGDPVATLERSIPVLPQIRELGIRPAYVAQDGLVGRNIPWGAFECFFVGGTDEWKLSVAAARLCFEARDKGKWVHVGRVNSEKRLRHALWMGAHSVDGNFLKFGPSGNVKRLTKWFRQQNFDMGVSW